MVRSANCDGGKQELGAATEAVRKVLNETEAPIYEECHDEYPIVTTVTLLTRKHNGSSDSKDGGLFDGPSQVVWSNDQRKLFK